MAISTRCGDAAVIVVDTSAWVEFLRDTGSPTCVRVKELLGADLATCDAIRMEVLAGARNERHRRDLGRLIARAASRSDAARRLRSGGGALSAMPPSRRDRSRSHGLSHRRSASAPTCRFCTAMPTSMPSHDTRRYASIRHDGPIPRDEGRAPVGG